MEYHICLIPGLGVDERLFRHLSLDPQFPQTILYWIKPAPDEELSRYAARLAAQTPANTALILIGVSFGGLMAIELAKLLNPILTIIISSIKNQNELPWYYKPAGKLKLPYYLPLHWGKYLYCLQAYLFGVKSPAEAHLLHQIIRELDITFVRWALTQIANWTNKTSITNLVHLHGTRDKLFPTRYLHNFIPVADGEHLMIISQAAYISQLINAELIRFKT